ncbi:MAG: SDR family NAD(P)-dependent oxidoreductase [Pseudomonadota bacterium]
MPQKVVFLTGAASGIGLETAKAILKSGDILWATDRDAAGLEDVAKLGARTATIDVTSEEDLRSCVNTAIAKDGRIDAVIANAGYANMGPFELVSMEDAQRQFDVNVFGAARTINAVLPHMRERGSGVIIATSSILAHVSYPMMSWYCASKHALEAMMDALRAELYETGIDVVKINPGAIRTKFASTAAAEFDRAILRTNDPDYQERLKYVSKSLEKQMGTGDLPETIANVMVKAIHADKPKVRYMPNKQARQLLAMKRILPARRLDKIFAAAR